MRTSLIEALLIGCSGLIASVLLFSIRRKLHYGLYRKQLTRLSLGMLIMGVGGGFIAYYSGIGYEKNTIVKAKVEGSLGVMAGTDAPVRKVVFEVAHPDAMHKIIIKPIDPIMRDSFEADIYLELTNPRHEIVMSAQKHFDTYTKMPGAHTRIERWRPMDTTFVPQYPGKYTLQVVPITVGIPEIEIWILDPQKKDGQRAFSWR